MRKLIYLLWAMSKQDLRIAWMAWRHSECPPWFRPALLVLTIYFFSPFNLALPMIGVIDDLVLVPLVLHFLISLLPAHVRAGQARM